MNKIRINTHGNEMPVSHGEWIDLRTAEDVELDPLEFKIISLGVAMELPEGYYAKVVPRSSTCKTFGIIMAKSIGIIEHNYSGNEDVWGFPAVAIRHTIIPKGSRICQFHLVKQDEPVEFEQVDDLGNPNRGGWGSTGTREELNIRALSASRMRGGTASGAGETIIRGPLKKDARCGCA